MVDSLEGTYKQHFMLHYNFPPYSVGETGRMGGPKRRREIGHGKLAWRAIRPLMPEKDIVPVHDPRGFGDHGIERFVVDGDGVRFVALDDGRGRAAEEPLRGYRDGSHQGGRASFAVLSDILGDEDHLGDMDFKVAGTTNGRDCRCRWTSRSRASPKRSCAWR